jgi:PAS domain S-box-containing protein
VLDISLETIRAVVLLGIFIFLLNAGRACFEMTGKGWNLIIGGFGLLLFGSLLDITDNFESLNRFIVIGNTEVEAFLEKFIGFLGGFCLLALGLCRWIPRIQRLPAEILQRKQAEEALRQMRDALEQRVRERTAQLEKENAERRQTNESLRQSESLFRAFIDNLPNEIFIRDANSRFLVVNREWEKIQGLTAEEIIGKTVHDIFPEERASTYLEQDRLVLETRQVIDQEVEFPTDGGTQTLRTIKFPILDSADNVAFIGGIAINITERKHAEERVRKSEKALKKRVADLEEAQRRLELQGEDLTRLAADLKTARDEAEVANRAKSDFLMGMSHELRTPLNAIIGFAETMSNETLGPVGSTKYREYCKDIHSSGRHLLNLINDILDLSKVESGAEELLEEDIEVPKVIQSVLRLVQEHAAKASVELELEIADDLPLLRADKRKVIQILINLLTNGIKFTNAGGKVGLRTWCGVDSGFVFQIVDTGIGIEPEDFPKAFSRFGQVNNVISRRYEGTGLGLPLTNALVELHGGSIDLQSQVGVGTTVTVYFPAARIGRSPQDTSSTNMDGREESGRFQG